MAEESVIIYILNPFEFNDNSANSTCPCGPSQTGADLSNFDVQELLVLTDSRFSTLQRANFDWFQPGGLLRPVEVAPEDMVATSILLWICYEKSPS